MLSAWVWAALLLPRATRSQSGPGALLVYGIQHEQHAPLHGGRLRPVSRREGIMVRRHAMQPCDPFEVDCRRVGRYHACVCKVRNRPRPVRRLLCHPLPTARIPSPSMQADARPASTHGRCRRMPQSAQVPYKATRISLTCRAKPILISVHTGHTLVPCAWASARRTCPSCTACTCHRRRRRTPPALAGLHMMRCGIGAHLQGCSVCVLHPGKSCPFLPLPARVGRLHPDRMPIIRCALHTPDMAGHS